MNKLQITLFGKLHIATDGGKSIAIESSKAEELLGFLLLSRCQPHTRDVIAETLWPGTDNELSRSYLRRTLWQLQHVLEEQAHLRNEPLLLVEQNWLQINPHAEVSIDFTAFEDAYAAVRGIPGESLKDDDVSQIDSAVDLYQGQLLEGWYQEWCIYERERLQHIYLVMLDKLMLYCGAQLRFEDGIEYGMRILRQDRAREYTHRQLMRLHYLARHRGAAIHQYERCVKALQEELGVQPTRRTYMLYEEIRRDSGSTPFGSNETDPGRESDQQVTLKEMLNQLQQARTDARTLEGRIERQIASIHRLLRDC